MAKLIKMNELYVSNTDVSRIILGLENMIKALYKEQRPQEAGEYRHLIETVKAQAGITI